jgi:Amt family ammonium transporter
MWVVLCAIVVFEMQAGFLCLEAGAVRTKNAANVALKNVSDFCIVSALFWALGYSLMHGPDGNGWFAWGNAFPDFSSGEGAETGENGFFLFQMAFAATAATIVSGAVAERERFKGYALLTVVMGAVIYPVSGHWIWGGTWEGTSEGWLVGIGFIDFAGSTAVHAVGGWAALCAILVLGPRLGRFTPKRRRFEENSTALMALGTLFLWIGWTAFNGGSALIFEQSVPTIIVHTMITAAFGGLTAILISGVADRFIRIDRVLNGALAGLVAGTAGVHLYGGPEAAIAGVTGAIVMYVASEVLAHWAIDDVVDAVPVHLAAGIAGTMMVPLLAPVEMLPAGSVAGQLRVQALGTLAVGAWVLVVAFPAALALRWIGLLRASPKQEVIGLNLAENHQTNAFQTLLTQMGIHSRNADFSKRIRVERSTEAGAVAARYNAVLDRVRMEMSERMAAVEREQALRQKAVWTARHDRLTGLGNRMLLEELAQEYVAEPRLVLAIDLDRFKDANDAYGHEAGDEILRVCAARLKAVLRQEKDFALRIGGDEFIVILEHGGSPAAGDFMADALLEALIVPIPFGKLTLRIGASIGVAYCKTGASLATGLKHADLALYEAKFQGRNRVVSFTDDIGAMHDNKLQLMEDFKRALSGEELNIVMQPQVNAQTLELVGIEVLARWNHPTRGMLRPDTFLPIATELRVLDELDARVLDLALEAREHLRQRLGFAPDISVNVSARRLLDPTLIRQLRDRTDLPRNGLAFEILESAFLDNEGERLTRQLDGLKSLGIRIEVDDFGTGHASFASVLLLRPDRLKIDRLFVDGIDVDPARRDLVHGIIEMAQTVSAEVVVEGVETNAQAKILKDLGADILQGYLFARPMNMSAFEAWLNDYLLDRSAG